MSSKSSDTNPLLVGAVLVIGAVIWFVIHFWYLVVGLIVAGALVFVVIKLAQRNAARREHLEAERPRCWRVARKRTSDTTPIRSAISQHCTQTRRWGHRTDNPTRRSSPRMSTTRRNLPRNRTLRT